MTLVTAAPRHSTLTFAEQAVSPKEYVEIYTLCEGRMAVSISRLLGEPTPNTPWRTRSVTVPVLRNRRGLLHSALCYIDPSLVITLFSFNLASLHSPPTCRMAFSNVTGGCPSGSVTCTYTITNDCQLRLHPSAKVGQKADKLVFDHVASLEARPVYPHRATSATFSLVSVEDENYSMVTCLVPEGCTALQRLQR